MKILVLTNMFPHANDQNLYQGIFVKEQYEGLLKLNKSFVELYVLRGKNIFSKYFLSIFNVYILLLKKNFDIVHIHYGLSGIFLFFKIFLKNPPIFVITFHGSDLLSKTLIGKFVRYFSIYISSKCDGIICISDEIKCIFNKCNYKTFLLPCGVNAKFFKPSNKKKRYFVFPGAKSNTVKNFPLFLNIMNSYNKIYSSYSYKCLEGLDRKEVLEIVQNSSAMIMTSFREGSPQSVKEALSCDIPVISADVGDVSLLTKHLAGTHIFSKFDSSDIIAKQVNNCILESQDTIGYRRARIIDLCLSNEDICKKLLLIYKDLLDK